ncbi:MAG: penicillin acylase family protein [Planctomycetota bacterium]|jgi:penicillin amidase|nr:penicillin acylase family protein [Planctomycetota bacterium]
MRRRLPLLLLLAALLGCAAIGWWWSGVSASGLPRRFGAASLAGLRAEVTVRFDHDGVPHIRARSELDAVRALGWLHANDRFEQMELMRRWASGRLAEVVGEGGLAKDLDARRFRLRHAASEHAAALEPASRALVEAYAEGVNAWIAARSDDLPPLFRILRFEPEPWTKVDSLCIPVLLARGLSFTIGVCEEDRFRWLGALGPAALDDLVAGAPLVVDEELVGLARAACPPAEGGAVPRGAPVVSEGGGGSNNWAIGASRTATGAPLVANDPHLALAAPPTWYAVHLESPEVSVAGLSLPGAPGVMIGHNASVAWSFTNARLDDVDLFVEELDPGGERVRRGADWVALGRESVTVDVRGADPVTLELARTDRGPLFPADPGRGLPARSLAWSAYEPADPVRAFARLSRARDVDEVLAAMELHPFLPMNLVAADRAGGLLFTVVGRRPDRRGMSGRFPVLGAQSSVGWDGLLPHDANPTVLRPAVDFLVTANEDVRPPGYDAPYSDYFDTAQRGDRIRQRIAAEDGWTAQGAADLQLDARSLYPADLLAALGGPFEGDARRCYEALAAWDGTFSAERGEPALFALAERALLEAITEDDFGPHGLPRLPALNRRPFLLAALRGECAADWFDDRRTPRREARSDVVASALASAWRAGVARWGEDLEEWRYGDLHRLTLSHPLDAVPLVGGWFDRGPFPVGGSGTTIRAFGGDWRGEELPAAWGASVRVVFDLADPDHSRFVLPMGQSGHPGDPHYDDLLPRFLAGETVPLAWSEAGVEAACASRLVLRPGP